MPAGFDKCVADGGKVRTMSGPNAKAGLAEGQYRHVCILRGKVFMGEIKTKEGK